MKSQTYKNAIATSCGFLIHCVMHLMIIFTLFLHTTAYDHDFESAGCCLAYSCWFETKVQYWMPAVVCYVEMGWGAGG